MPNVQYPAQRKHQTQTMKLTRTGQRALEFDGTELASESSRSHAGKESNRWHELAVYKTDSRNYVVTIQYRTQWLLSVFSTSAKVALAMFAAAAAFPTAGYAVTYTVDFRQPLDPAVVTVSGFQQKETTANGLRILTAARGTSTVSFSLAGLTTNQLGGDFTATLTFSGMAGFDSPGFEQGNRVIMRAPWGAFGGEDFAIARRFGSGWGGQWDDYVAARWVSDNDTWQWVKSGGLGFANSGTMTMQRIGDQASFYANGTLLGTGSVDSSKRVAGFYVQSISMSGSPVDITFGSFTLSGPNVVPWANALMTDGGVGTNGYGFNLIGNSNVVAVVEACSDIANPMWQPVQTNTFTSEPLYFSDPGYTNYPSRFYRVKMP